MRHQLAILPLPGQDHPAQPLRRIGAPPGVALQALPERRVRRAQVGQHRAVAVQHRRAPARGHATVADGLANARGRHAEIQEMGDGAVPPQRGVDDEEGRSRRRARDQVGDVRLAGFRDTAVGGEVLDAGQRRAARQAGIHQLLAAAVAHGHVHAEPFPHLSRLRIEGIEVAGAERGGEGQDLDAGDQAREVEVERARRRCGRAQRGLAQPVTFRGDVEPGQRGREHEHRDHDGEAEDGEMAGDARAVRWCGVSVQGGGRCVAGWGSDATSPLSAPAATPSLVAAGRSRELPTPDHNRKAAVGL